MSDDLSKRGGIDRKLISLKETHEVEYWTKEFGVSEVELERLVKHVGHSADKVRDELKRASS